MGDLPLSAKTYAMGPRAPVMEEEQGTIATSTSGVKLPTRVLFERDTTTTTAGSGPNCSGANANSALCEKPVGPSVTNIAIGIGVAVGVVAFLVLIFLHRRSMKRLRMEDLNDPHKSLDFGIAEPGGKKNRRSFLGLEKDPQHKRQQLSMDLNLSSPYLLPPEVHNSRESLNSLARTLHQADDPYRPVSRQADAMSMRSKQGRSSIYSAHNGRDMGPPRSPTWSPNGSMPNSRRNSMLKGPLAPPEPAHFKAQQRMLGEPTLSTPPPPAYFESDQGYGEPIIPQALSVSPPNRSLPAVPTIQEPSLQVERLGRKPVPSATQFSPAEPAVGMVHDGFDFGNEQQYDDGLHREEDTAGALGVMDFPEPSKNFGNLAPPAGVKTLPSSPRPVRNTPPAVPAPVIEEPQEWHEENPAQMPTMPTMPEDFEYEQEERGRNMQRTSHLYGPQGQGGGLGVPPQANHRLSVGFRPLPPDEIMESDDPEFRANRIRSFYKEYFDDSRPTEPVPPIPQNYAANQYGANQYEDYNQNYLGEAAYFDPETNAFVMPYAQPVARRAMTPPPSGQRFPGGPRGPARQYHGSMGGGAMGPPGMRGPPRPGSSASDRFRQGPPGMMGPRAGSAMSGRPQRAPLPPPVDLPTLPTPSKLRDDSFAIFSATDFAPPTTYAERARGRSQSPAGERRPYKLNVPVASPLVTAFDELSVLPSPHLLRKSGTFTALEFAPPRKFANEDTGSETGSIRSNRSGISAVQLGAIRSGAGRISRLPGDTVFTQAALQDTLKPEWGMRQ